ncbi:hypothetical protein [uncultured Nocardioides sp.]|uniref:hypothetical protein n=1 Tax=uncultured Nocardioides sp. TaxID=198441 RepID=UPI00261C0DD9|nr:hypothetical protein [uncultured Nocardioides sp.]
MSTETDKPTPESTGDPKARTRAEVKAKRAERREERQSARAEKAATKATAAEEKQKAKAEKASAKESAKGSGGGGKEKSKGGGTSAGPAIKGGIDSLRTLVGQVVWIAAVVCALFLAVGALCIALDANRDNALVSFVLEGAETVSLGVFSVRGDGVFDFVGANSQIKNALVNYGLGALLYLVVGRIVERVLRP